MTPRFVIDCGSRSIKLHAASPAGVSLRGTRSWDPIGNRNSVHEIGILLDGLVATMPAEAPVLVVGTAAARRSRRLARAIGTACATRGWVYRTLSQRLEARLIRDAFPDCGNCDIVNAGGGSIQIVGGGMSLLGFGITDLNLRFALSDVPSRRDCAAATAFVSRHLPELQGPFIYSGGELSYLRAAGATVGPDGRCAAAEFLRVAARVDAMDDAELRTVSPFDPGWSRGAVASNAIVRACLARSGSAFYIASDVNIGDGIIRRLASNAADSAWRR
ncbi:MAG TPA: hypothetical protein VGN80_08175 [Devosiaceae bacterium]|nr:hypothetical protein [Devosiaceae bacterium]